MPYERDQGIIPPERKWVTEDGCYYCGSTNLEPEIDQGEIIGYNCKDCGAGMDTEGEAVDLGGMNAVEDGLPYGHRL